MTPDEFISLAENPHFITGIYNYCDRWCERCPMTDRCLLFASTAQLEEMAKDVVEDRQNAMLRQVEDSTQLAIDMLNQISIDQGLDPKVITDGDPDFEIRRAKQNGLKISPLGRLSKSYLDKSLHWIHHCDAIAVAKDEDLFQAAALQLPRRDPEKELEELKSALDVISWYQFQIHVKLVRAQTSKFDDMLFTDADAEDEYDEADGEYEGDDEYLEESHPYINDSDGSAKVALIGMDHSIQSWQTLLQHFPDQESGILEVLSILQQLVRMTEETFPEARNVKRPGLDE